MFTSRSVRLNLLIAIGLLSLLTTAPRADVGWDDKNFGGIDVLVGNSDQMLTPDLSRHQASVLADPSTANHHFKKNEDYTYEVGLFYERQPWANNRFGLKVAWQSIGRPSLEETSDVSLGVFGSGHERRTYSFNASRMALTAYYRHLFFSRVKLSPFVGGGIGRMRAVARVSEAINELAPEDDLFSDHYSPIVRWVPHSVIGLDILFPPQREFQMAIGLQSEVLYNARFSGFHTSSRSLNVVNGKLTDVATGSAGRPAEANFSGQTLSLSVKVFY